MTTTMPLDAAPVQQKNALLNWNLWVLEAREVATRPFDWAEDMLIPDESFYSTRFRTHVHGERVRRLTCPTRRR